MPIMPATFTPHEMKTSVINVYSYDKKAFCGTLKNPYYPQEMPFYNLVQFIFLMDGMLNALHFPQESMARRSFQKKDGQKIKVAKGPVFEGNPIATFKINVMFRQNASWQGSMVWLDKEMESPFRSVLEMIMLIDNVLTEDRKS